MAEQAAAQAEREQQSETRDIIVALPFTITTQDNEKLTFQPGMHRGVPLAVAEHWYTKVHLQKEGEPPPTAEAGGPSSDQDRAARLAAEEEVTRLKVQLERLATDRTKIMAERDELQNRVNALEAECADLRERVPSTEVEDATTEEEPSVPGSDVGVRRKGRKWFVHRGEEVIGEFPSREAADAKAAALRTEAQNAQQGA